jgi:hypothetical protein
MTHSFFGGVRVEIGLGWILALLWWDVGTRYHRSCNEPLNPSGFKRLSLAGCHFFDSFLEKFLQFIMTFIALGKKVGTPLDRQNMSLKAVLQGISSGRKITPISSRSLSK